jgi:hypothetical protein
MECFVLEKLFTTEGTENTEENRGSPFGYDPFVSAQGTEKTLIITGMKGMQGIKFGKPYPLHPLYPC